MKLTVAGSGSSGNCYILEDSGRKLILDAGCKDSDIKRGLNYDVMGVDACLVSHEHGDHCKYAPQILKIGADCYTGHKAVEPIYEATGALLKPLLERRWNHIGHWSVIPIEVNHDVPCYAFIIGCPSGESIMYATDFSYVGCNGKEYTFKSINIKHFLIAVNYSTDPSEKIEYRGHIYGGHSSLTNVLDFLQGSITNDCKSIVACHLSENHADEEKIKTELSKLSQTAQVGIAKKGMVFDL